MIGDAALPPINDEIAQRHAARNADLAGDDAMTANARVVPDLHEIINFGALADHRVAERAAIDRRVGADFHPVLDDDAAELRDLDMAARRADEKPKPGAANRAPGLNQDVVAKMREPYGDVGADFAVASDGHAAADDRCRRRCACSRRSRRRDR